MTTENMHLLPIDADSIGNILTEWQSGHSRMGVFALLPETEKAKLPLLQAACRERGVPLVGDRLIFP